MGRPRPWIPALGEAPQDLPGRPGELGPRPIWPGLQVSARHRILDLRLSPRDEAETKKRLDFLWTFVWNVEDYDCWTKEDRAYFEARDRGIIEGTSEETVVHLSGASADNVISIADRLAHA